MCDTLLCLNRIPECTWWNPSVLDIAFIPVLNHSYRIAPPVPGLSYIHLSAWQAYRSPGGPGIRLDGAMTAGNVVSKYFDSLLVKARPPRLSSRCDGW